MHIYNVQETALGRVAQRFVNDWESKEFWSVLFNLFGSMDTRSLKKLPTGAPDSMYVKPLASFVTHIWWREKAIGYLQLIDYIIERLRGGGERNLTEELVRPETGLNCDCARSEWLGNNAFRGSVEKLKTTLSDAIHFFNIQVVLPWIGELLENLDRACDERYEKVRAGLLEDITFPAYKKQFPYVDSSAYENGKSIMEVDAAHVYDLLMKTNAPDPLKRLFEINPRQLQELAVWRITGKGNADEFIASGEPNSSEDEDSEDTMPHFAFPWKMSRSGIILPS